MLGESRPHLRLGAQHAVVAGAQPQHRRRLIEVGQQRRVDRVFGKPVGGRRQAPAPVLVELDKAAARHRRDQVFASLLRDAEEIAHAVRQPHCLPVDDETAARDARHAMRRADPQVPAVGAAPLHQRADRIVGQPIGAHQAPIRAAR